MAHNKNINSFSRADISDALRIWERAAISLLDIRHNLISPDEAVRNYRLPASTFIYTSGAGAEILLNNQSFRVDRFGVFHGGKGTTLSILPAEGWLEYYMLLYKSGEPPFHKKEFAKLLEQTNPFRQQYGFSPDNPLFFGHHLRLIYEKWKGPTPLNLFYGKAAFYQLVYEVYEEVEKGRIQIFEPDLISMASRYMDQHYSDAITIQEVCDMLGISYSHFHRRFTKRFGKSPQEYLIQTRLAAATECLNNSEASIREIAQYCGFSDEFNFHRLFLKSVGMTPGAYREKSSANLRDDIIGNIRPFLYDWERRVSLDKPKGKGENFMFKQMKGKAVVAAALALMLLMSACGTGPANSNGEDSTPSSAVTSEVTEPMEEGTRTVSTILGDVEVPVNPQRIVVGGCWVGDVLAFGKMPIGIQDFYVKASPWSEQAKNITVLEKWEPEYIMALEPDLIITATFGNKKPDDYDDLSKIAPVVAFDWDDEPEERLPLMAQVLGQDAAEGEALVNEYNQKVEDYRKKLEETGILNKSITVFRNDGVVEGGLELGSENGWGGEVVYTLFGMPMPESAKELRSQENSTGRVSFEMVPELCGDYILLNQSEPTLIKQLDENAIWQSIPAVQKGNVFFVEPGKVYFPDIITDTYKLEVIAEALLKLAANQ
jgi:iron complex transport system substrate-binding protein